MNHFDLDCVMFSDSKMVPMALKIMLSVLVVLVALHFTTAQFDGMVIDCRPKTVPHQVTEAGCTPKDIFVNICEGTCRSLSEILMQRPWHNTLCQCCRTDVLENIPVQLDCGNEKLIHNVPSVKSCKCKKCQSY